MFHFAWIFSAFVSTKSSLFQWIVLSVGIAVTIMLALIVVGLLKRRRQSQSAKENEIAQDIEMRRNPPNLAQSESIKSRNDKDYNEDEESLSVGSRNEGVEGKEGKVTNFVSEHIAEDQAAEKDVMATNFEAVQVPGAETAGAAHEGDV